MTKVKKAKISLVLSYMITFPHGKINLGLNVTQKRNDGFHNIETVFFPIHWNDILEIVEDKQNNSKEKVTFSHSGLKIQGENKNNLVIKSYKQLDNDYSLPPVKIHLHKSIPMGAGLGGGSADAAYTIRTINDLFKLGLDSAKQTSYAKKLGSDCAFFIEGKPVLGTGKGDQFEPIELNFEGMEIMVIWPAIHSGTAEAYSGIVPSVPDKSLREILKSDIKLWKHELKNDFEKTIFPIYPELEKIKFMLYESGAVYASMSGSGSAIFGLFENKTPTIPLPEHYHVHITNFSFH